MNKEFEEGVNRKYRVTLEQRKIQLLVKKRVISWSGQFI
jgi:hypothetical protein